MEQTVTTIEELMPHLRADMTAKELGAVVIALVPNTVQKSSSIFGLRQRLALQARDSLGRTWKDATVLAWLSPCNQTQLEAERHREASRRWQAENAGRTKAKNRRWRTANLEHARKTGRQRQRRWHSENPEYRESYRKERWAADPTLQLAHNLRCRVRGALRGRNKSARTIELIGCSIEELRSHLERQFTEDMSWSNMGAWHVDHRVPVASFDLTDPAEQRRAFHFSNLQPLWAEDNYAKGSLYEGVRHRHGVRSGSRGRRSSAKA